MVMLLEAELRRSHRKTREDGCQDRTPKADKRGRSSPKLRFHLFLLPPSLESLALLVEPQTRFIHGKLLLFTPRRLST